MQANKLINIMKQISLHGFTTFFPPPKKKHLGIKMTERIVTKLIFPISRYYSYQHRYTERGNSKKIF